MSSPVYEAVRSNDGEMLTFLHHLNADVGAEFPNESEPEQHFDESLLHVAARCGHTKMIESLNKDYGLKINRLDSL